MSNIYYVLRIILITVVIVVLMQIHVGNKTVERHVDGFIRKSDIMSPARDIAQGGFVFFKHFYRDAVKTTDSFVTKNFRNENSPGHRRLLELKRSLKFENEKTQKEEALREKEEARAQKEQSDREQSDDDYLTE